MTNEHNEFKPGAIQKTRTSLKRFNQSFAQSVKKTRIKMNFCLQNPLRKRCQVSVHNSTLMSEA